MARSSDKQFAQMERKVQTREAAMRILLAAEDAESARITRMLHDNVAQYVAALQLGFRGLERELDMGSDVKVTLQSLYAISQSVGEELHRVALELRPTSLDDYGLVRSLTTFLGEWSVIAKTAVDFDYIGLGDGRLPQPLENNLYRIIREMLHVVSQQTKVTRVSVMLLRQADAVVSVVEHNGEPHERGCDREGNSIASLQARVALLEGTFTVEDCAISGRSMIARVPGNRKK